MLANAAESPVVISDAMGVYRNDDGALTLAMTLRNDTAEWVTATQVRLLLYDVAGRYRGQMNFVDKAAIAPGETMTSS